MNQVAIRSIFVGAMGLAAVVGWVLGKVDLMPMLAVLGALGLAIAPSMLTLGTAKKATERDTDPDLEETKP